MVKKTDQSNDKEEAAASQRRRRVRALIIGSLAAGGAFQLNGWQAQAHGNRSSHSSVGEFQDVSLTRPPVVELQSEEGNALNTKHVAPAANYEDQHSKPDKPAVNQTTKPTGL